MKFENHQHYNCKVQLDTNETYLVDANWIHNNQLDNWLGWYCNAGVTRISINANFDVYSGECNNDHLGNLFTNWDLLQEPNKCKQKTCTGCTDDLIVEKRKTGIEGH